MIYHLIESMAAHPSLIHAIPPDGLLNAAEERQFCALRTPKRRRDWLLGRWTAKRLLQMTVAQELGEYAPLDSFTIINTPKGAPRVRYGLLGEIPLSISHREDRAFCAVAQPDRAAPRDLFGLLGVDIERIEPRTGSFAEDYFSEAELASVQRAQAWARDVMITAIWSAKESALKALQLGLTVDTRAVICCIDPVRSVPETWTSFEICYDVTRLNHAAPTLKGWWRMMEDYVLTCVSSIEMKLVTPAHVERLPAYTERLIARGIRSDIPVSDYVRPAMSWEVQA
jgi:4'-phosphopantetheinyl transferase